MNHLEEGHIVTAFSPWLGGHQEYFIHDTPILLPGQIPNERVGASISHVPLIAVLKESPSRPSDLLHLKSHTGHTSGAFWCECDPIRPKSRGPQKQDV